MCFGGRKTLEERKICLKIRLFRFPEMLVIRSMTSAACKVVSSSTLIGPFEFELIFKFKGCLRLRSNSNGLATHSRLENFTSNEIVIYTSLFYNRWFNSHTILYIHKLSHTPHTLSLESVWLVPLLLLAVSSILVCLRLALICGLGDT